ncbi:hypothetical protein FA13DRAFT_1177646 [Coprinellus micaceus]|uniref:Nephrocystin 3-like N-terminal domain-containing protein n=1 Tax=Coprinellus micaceus TaxID=71717 RepID=A0A4Y7SUB5_COPMI|nr:hypothetical protein FA13DRAFT_1177646 [Coprinellus micaceus]
MRNRVCSPPNSQCFPGTRRQVMKKIHTWMDSSLLRNHPHIFWVYGYAGCGKSAIAQAICEYYAGKGRLAASFFFFRGAGHRSRAARFATTLASQVAAAIPATAPFIEAAIKANPALLTSDTSLSSQIEHLVYRPIDAVKWDRLAAALRHGPFLITLDGLDECEDHDEISAFIEFTIRFFDERPRIPIRFLVTSRVESHIHQCLHTSKQVKLLDLVNHTSDADILAALEAAIAREKPSRILVCDEDWPSSSDKSKLVKHIGGSYIFMMTIVKALFDPGAEDGLTPMKRLPHILAMEANFDGLYFGILKQAQHLFSFHPIVHTVALAREPLSVSQIAEITELDTAEVANVLIRLHALLHVPGDDHSPVTLWHTSLRDFLTSEERARHLFADPRHHLNVASGVIHAATSPQSHLWSYSRSFAVGHLTHFVEAVRNDTEPFGAEADKIISLLEKFGEGQPALEVACRAKEWKLVRALVNAGANVDTHFGDGDNLRVALHAACHYRATEIVYFLLDKGADPNIVGQYLLFFRIYPSQCPESQPHSGWIKLV